MHSVLDSAVGFRWHVHISFPDLLLSDIAAQADRMYLIFWCFPVTFHLFHMARTFFLYILSYPTILGTSEIFSRSMWSVLRPTLVLLTMPGSRSRPCVPHGLLLYCPFSSSSASDSWEPHRNVSTRGMAVLHWNPELLVFLTLSVFLYCAISGSNEHLFFSK